MVWGKKLILSLNFCHHVTEVLARWQQNEETRVILVLDDFDSSAFTAFEVDVLLRVESRS